MPDTTTTGFKLTTAPSKVLLAYLTERVSADADAPHRGLPFIDGKDNVRVKPTDWTDWFFGVADTYTGTPSKKQILAVLKDAGLVQRVYALPAHDAHPELTGKSFGLYTGPVPNGVAKLARRVTEREAPAAKTTAPAETTETAAPAPESGFDISRVEASTLQVGDVICTTRSNSRKAIADGGDDVQTIAAITRAGERVQARNADGKVIRSCEPTTQVWRGRNG